MLYAPVLIVKRKGAMGIRFCFVCGFPVVGFLKIFVPLRLCALSHVCFAVMLCSLCGTCVFTPLCLYGYQCGHFGLFVEDSTSVQALIGYFYNEIHHYVFRVELAHKVVCGFHCASGSQQVVV